MCMQAIPAGGRLSSLSQVSQNCPTLVLLSLCEGNAMPEFGFVTHRRQAHGSSQAVSLQSPAPASTGVPLCTMACLAHAAYVLETQSIAHA